MNLHMCVCVCKFGGMYVCKIYLCIINFDVYIFIYIWMIECMYVCMYVWRYLWAY